MPKLKTPFNVRAYNRLAWDREVERGNPWTVPVTQETIAAARRGQFSVLLTETRPVPHGWFPPFTGLRLLGLACGGGQQGPVFAALGANVTIFDNSPRQLERDRIVAEREGLKLVTLEGDMRDLSVFDDGTFDLVFHPVSNVFCPNVLPVWREAHRVLRRGGLLLAGLANPLGYLFDFDKLDQGVLEVKHRIPYSDLESQGRQELAAYLEKGLPLEFGHSLTDLIGGQCDAGFILTGFYEDYDPSSAISKYSPTYMATRAVKP